MDGVRTPGRALWWVLAALGVLFAAGGVAVALWRPRLWVRLEFGAWHVLVGLAVAFALLALAGWRISRARASRRRSLERRWADGVRLRAQEEANAARRRFLRRLDHELKNPVTALRALAAQGSAGLGGEEAWDTAGAQAQRMGRLVGDLRGLAELEVSPLDLEPVRVDQVVLEAIDDLAESEWADALTQRDLRVHLPEAPWPLPEVQGDPDLLRLAFYNVIGNAVKYSEPGDRIEVTGSEDGSLVVLDVADTGRGIPESERDVVFEELARGRNVADVPGSGVGLSLVKVILQRHGGDVRLRSREDEGTSLRLTLPAPAGRRGKGRERP